MKQNQPNPFERTHADVPVTWDAGGLTGLSVSDPSHERGIFNTPARTARGHTIAQVWGGVVGAYLNSLDLVDGSPGYKMMIAPQYNWPAAPQIRPFATAQSVVTVSTDLQVPAATDFKTSVSNNYVVFDLLLTDFHGGVAGTRIVYHAGLYASRTPGTEIIGFDVPTQNVIICGRVFPGSKYLTVLQDSSLMQAHPWTGWAHFHYQMSRNEFKLGLADAIRAYPSMRLSANPADYVLTEWHLNAELHYTFSEPATLGWSMQNTLIQLTQ